MSLVQIANTIREQLGTRALLMIGAKDYVALSREKNVIGGLMFRIGRNSKKVSKVIIKLNAMDLYDMEFWYVRGTKFYMISSEQGLYADQLNTAIEEHTGLYTSF